MASSIHGFSTIPSPAPFREPSSVFPAEKWLPFSYSLRQFQFSLASGSAFLFELSGFLSYPQFRFDLWVQRNLPAIRSWAKLSWQKTALLQVRQPVKSSLLLRHPAPDRAQTPVGIPVFVSGFERVLKCAQGKGCTYKTVDYFHLTEIGNAWEESRAHHGWPLHSAHVIRIFNTLHQIKP